MPQSSKANVDKSVFHRNMLNEDLESKITAALERIGQAYRLRLWDYAQKNKLSPVQAQILIFLHEHEDIAAGISLLAKEFGLTKPTVSDAVKKLRMKGLVEYSSLARDKRRKVLVLNKAGIQVVTQLLSWADAFRQVVQNLPKGVRMELWRNLVLLIIGLQQRGLINIGRMCIKCRNFQAQHLSTGKYTYYCALLGMPLTPWNLRMDCTEFQAA